MTNKEVPEWVRVEKDDGEPNRHGVVCTFRLSRDQHAALEQVLRPKCPSGDLLQLKLREVDELGEVIIASSNRRVPFARHE